MGTGGRVDGSGRRRAPFASSGGWAVVAVCLGLVVALVTLVGLSTYAWGSPDALVSRAWQVVDDGWPAGWAPEDSRSGLWPPDGWPDGVWPPDSRT